MKPIYRKENSFHRGHPCSFAAIQCEKRNQEHERANRTSIDRIAAGRRKTMEDDTDSILLKLGLPLGVSGHILEDEIEALAGASDIISAATYNNTIAMQEKKSNASSSSSFDQTHDPLDSHDVMDPEARSLMKALIAHKHAAIKREDYVEAKLAKQQAEAACSIGRRLAALRKLSRANNDIAGMQDQDVDVMDDEAIAGAKRRRLHAEHRSVMQDREAAHLRKQLDLMREEALSKSISVSVAVGLDSFLGRKERERAKLEAKLSYRHGFIGNSDDEDSGEEASEGILFTNRIMTHEHEVATTRLALERLVRDWISHGITGDTIYPPRVTLSETREYDHLISVFGMFPLEILLAGHKPSVTILLEAIDFQIKFLAEHLGVAQIFRSCIFVLTMVLQPTSQGQAPDEKHTHANAQQLGLENNRGYSTASNIRATVSKQNRFNHGSSASGYEPPLDNVTQAALHLLRTLYTVHRRSKSCPSEQLFDAIDKTGTGFITSAQLRTEMLQNKRCREIIQCRPRLMLLQLQRVQDEIMKGFLEDESLRINRDEFVSRVNGLLTSESEKPTDGAMETAPERKMNKPSVSSSESLAPSAKEKKNPHPPPPEPLTEEQLIARSRKMTLEHENFDIFDNELPSNTARIGAIAVLPLLIKRIGASISWMQPPAACQYSHDPKNQDMPFPVGGPKLFENHNVRELIDCAHHVARHPGVGVDIVAKACWPASSQAGNHGASAVTTWGESDEIEAAQLCVLNSLLCTFGFVPGTVLSPETLMPLCVERVFHGDGRMRWCSEHVIATIYRIEGHTRRTSEALLSLRIPQAMLLKIESRLCREFTWLMESKRKEKSVTDMQASGDDAGKVPQKMQLPAERVLGFHSPAWAQQGCLWPTPEEMDGETLEKQARSLVNEWDGIRKLVSSGSKNNEIPLHERLAASMLRSTRLDMITKLPMMDNLSEKDGSNDPSPSKPGETITPQPPADLDAAAAEAEAKAEAKAEANAESKKEKKKKKKRKTDVTRSKSKKQKSEDESTGGLERTKSEKSKKKKKRKKSKSMSRKKSKAKIAPAGVD